MSPEGRVPAIEVGVGGLDGGVQGHGHRDGQADQPRCASEVPYHLLDLVDPSDEFTVQQFQAAARSVLDGIAERGHRALLVGGTGLYLRSVIDDLTFPGRFPDVAAALVAELERAGPEGSPGALQAVAGLHDRLAVLDPVAAARMEPTNRRRVLRALEVTLGSGRPFSAFGPGLEAYPPTRFALVGLPLPGTSIDGWRNGWAPRWRPGSWTRCGRWPAAPAGCRARLARRLGYRELLSHLEGGVPLEAALSEAIRRTRVFARRQWAWFRRDPRIVWVGDHDQPVSRVTARLRRRGSRARWETESNRARRDHSTTTTHFTKHHGAGNDFLVTVDLDGRHPLDPAAVRALCDRHLGVGADGVIRVLDGRQGADLGMELRNADGLEAEMSGNGIRCLAQAAVEAGLVSASGLLGGHRGRDPDRRVPPR